ncbi:LysR family transcriptional regulator [Serratia fonticola]|uniref:LysR substrate-binding domain-containing protein n=1 Tax=Serratia fonticola TaxID=47917 RepID=UPI0008FD20DD|nr:LysR substrate-binding domain-containing protein [Serratia fonticola]OIX91970.1 LysR family transcriptional regulator [Serratia fonticola]QCR63033.1 LysR family transcriptional regulator [Serratia fonticola]
MKELPKINQLRNLRAIINYGGVRPAAIALGQTQPAITKSINELERILGTRLLVRGESGIILTKTGKAFETRMNAILNELERAVDEIKQIENISHGEVVFGCSHLPAFDVIPELITDFKHKHQDARITVIEGQFSELVSALRLGRMDFFVGNTLDLSSREFTSEHLMTLEFSIMGRKGHPLKNSKSLSELKNANWFLPAATFGYYNDIEDIIFPDGKALANSVIYGDSISIARKLIFDHDYLFAGPTNLINEPSCQGLLDIIPISEKLPVSQYSIIYRKNQILTPIAVLLIKLIQSAYRE